MQTILIIGNTKSEREQAIEDRLASWNVSRFDRIILDSDLSSVGISDVRAFIKRLSLAPQQGDIVAGIIPDSDRLTVEAQQALLKTLEEPPARVRIILAASNSAVLLSTILSRCQLQPLTPTVHEVPDAIRRARIEEVTMLLGSSPGQIVSHLSKLGKTKGDVHAFLFTAIETLAHDIKHPAATPSTSIPVPHKLRVVRALLTAKKYLAANVNGQQLLEHAFLSQTP